MRYYSFPPFKYQYFFPITVKKYSFLLSFYQPYSWFAKIYWKLWINIAVLRYLSSQEDIEKYIPEITIRNFIGKKATLAFNTGSPGPEQKITALGILNNQKFFIKFAQSDLSKNFVRNEEFILRQLQNQDFVPKILDFNSSSENVLLKTTLLTGKRFQTKTINNEIVLLLLKIASLQISTKNSYDSKIQSSFAHGDFCPWNLMLDKNNIKVFDWEMAGTYPLGYDLFTFIFNTAFFLSSERDISKIIDQDINHINTYFRNFNIYNWNKYLTSFGAIKKRQALNKNNIDLVNFYNKIERNR